MAKEHAKGLSKKSDSELRKHIRDQVSPPTKFKHLVAHSHVHDDGSATSHVHDSEHIADEHLKHFKNLHVKHGGISATIHGTYHNPGHKDHGKVKAVATQTFKSTSGPHKGTAGTFTLR